MQAVHVQHFLRRARDFIQGMRFFEDDTEYNYSAALLAVHGAISYCDALRTGLGDDRVSSEDHQQAATALRGLLTARKYPKLDGIDRLSRLIGRKSDVAYARAAISSDTARSLIQQAERFAVWAETTGKALRIEGWTDE